MSHKLLRDLSRQQTQGMLGFGFVFLVLFLFFSPGMVPAPFPAAADAPSNSVKPPKDAPCLNRSSNTPLITAVPRFVTLSAGAPGSLHKNSPKLKVLKGLGGAFAYCDPCVSPKIQPSLTLAGEEGGEGDVANIKALHAVPGNKNSPQRFEQLAVEPSQLPARAAELK